MRNVQEQPENTITPACTISGMRVMLSISLVVWVWALCWWAPFYFVVLYMTPLLVLPSWLVSWLVERHTAKWEFHWSPWRCRMGLTALFVLVVAMPISSYVYGVWIADQLFQGLGIEARLVYRKISVMEEFGFDEHRGAVSLYEYLEPAETAKEKIIQRVQSQKPQEGVGRSLSSRGWQIGTIDDGAFTIICDSGVRENTISTENDQLGIVVRHLSSPYCQLR